MYTKFNSASLIDATQVSKSIDIRKQKKRLAKISKMTDFNNN